MAGDYIAKEFEKLGLVSFPGLDSYFHHFRFTQTYDRNGQKLPGIIAWLLRESKSAMTEYRTDTLSSRNVLGLLYSDDPAYQNEVILIGGHYDHEGTRFIKRHDSIRTDIYFGADDNASGTSAVLELARYFTRNRALLKRSMLFMAYGAEEEGLFGSAAFTSDSAFPAENFHAMINLDMIGRLRDTLTMTGVGTSPQWDTLIKQSIVSPPVTMRLVQKPETRTDMISFHARRIPTISFFTGYHEDYHQPTDTPEKLNKEGLLWITERIADLAWALHRTPKKLPMIPHP